MKRTSALVTAVAAGIAAAMMLSGCSGSAGASTDSSASAAPEATELRLGYFANATHAPALVGLQEGIFEKNLGDVELKTEIFNAGPAAIEALSAGAIDATYIGPNPSINTFIQSEGASARIVAGATSGGAALVVREGITSADDLKGATLATPQLGNTQDVALRSWLDSEGLSTSTTGGGDVTITPTENAQTLTLFQNGDIDGAWLPEPWVSRLVLEAGAKVLVDEASLWKDGAFPTTVLLVNKDFLDKNPGVVKKLVTGHVEAVAWLNDNAADAATVINERLTVDAGKALKPEVLDRALESVTFSDDPQADTFPKLLEAGVKADLTEPGDLDGLFDLSILNSILKEAGQEPVSADGLGKE